MKKLSVFVSVLLTLFLSCTKNENLLEKQQEDSTSIEQFSILLSKAVYSEPSLRNFIKDEALQRKDFDFDVFYPLVKNELIDGERTFQEILEEYDTSNVLPLVEMEHPLLTIFVPDWSWVNDDCFSVEKWDCSIPDVGVSFLAGNNARKIYWNGEYAFTMKVGEFCSTPTMIVKDNDRLVADANTKCPGRQTYSFFCDDLIDLSSKSLPKTKTSSSYTTYDLPYEVASEFVDNNVLTKRTSSAYAVNAHDERIFQRDHIYYGMTSQIDSGYVNPNYHETLYRFKLSPNATGLMDDPKDDKTGNDFVTNTYYYEASWGSAKKLSESQIASMSWGKGAADLHIRINIGVKVITKNVTVSFSDAFYVKKVELRENYNWLGALKSRTYYLGVGTDGGNKEWLEPKWVVANLQLFYWDLSQFPTSYIVEFIEYDKAAKKTWKDERTFTFAANFSSSVEASVPIEIVTVKRGYGYGVSATYSKTYSNVVETTEDSDNLGSFFVHYTDKVFLDKVSSRARVKTYSTGAVDAQIIPFYE